MLVKMLVGLGVYYLRFVLVYRRACSDNHAVAWQRDRNSTTLVCFFVKDSCDEMFARDQHNGHVG